jgi:hypothetical protein
MAISVNDFCFIDFCYAFRRIAEFSMDMSVDKKHRAVVVNEPPEDFKSSVTQVFCVMNIARGRMRNDDIDTSTPPHF